MRKKPIKVGCLLMLSMGLLGSCSIDQGLIDSVIGGLSSEFGSINTSDILGSDSSATLSSNDTSSGTSTSDVSSNTSSSNTSSSNTTSSTSSSSTSSSNTSSSNTSSSSTSSSSTSSSNTSSSGGSSSSGSSSIITSDSSSASSEGEITYTKASGVVATDTEYHVKGIVAGMSKSDTIIVDDTGAIYVYGTLPSGIILGDYVLVSGVVKSYNRAFEFDLSNTSNSIVELEGTKPNYSTKATPLTKDIADGFPSYTSFSSADIIKYSYTSTAGVSGNFTTLNLTGSTTVIEPIRVDSSKFTIETGKTYSVEGYINGYSSKYSYASLVLTKLSSATEVESVAIAAPTSSTVEVGKEILLTASVTPAAASQDVTWTAVPASSVSFNNTGLDAGQVRVKGLVATDEVTIIATATGTGKTATIKIKVEKTDEDGPITFKIASMNDVHGSIENVGYEPGLSKISTYLKSNYTSNDLLLANGDMWQGNGESNLNKGKLVTEWMNYAGFDSMTLGNHDFDWGKEALVANKEVANFPFLSANLYNYNNSTVTTHADDVADSSVVLNVGKYQVGVIGAIGRDQYTSITSTQVSEFDFLNPYSLIKEESTRLRKAGCEIIIVDIHTGQNDSTGVLTDDMLGLAATDTETSRTYADAVFCGHVHSAQSNIYNGVPFLRADANGKGISEVSFTINTDLTVTKNDYDVKSISSSLANDEGSEAILNTYRTTQDPVLDEAIGSGGQLTVGSYVSNANMAGLNAKVMYDAAVKKGVTDLDLALVNGARNSLDAGDITFRDIYRSFPFDNYMVIMTVSEKDLYNETVKYVNYFYNPNHLAAPTSSGTKTYKIAVIDYLGMHKNANHQYNYFASQTNVQTFATSDIFPRNLVRDFLNTQTSFNGTDYANYQSDYSYA